MVIARDWQRTAANIRAQAKATTLPTCNAPWPPSLHDLHPLPCHLPPGHRSPEHWHPPLWAGHPGVVWLEPEVVRDAL